VKEPVRALEIYRNKDMAEKAFGDLKERLGARRMLVSSESGLNGKLFVEFIALIERGKLQALPGDHQSLTFPGL
jgi:transposase